MLQFITDAPDAMSTASQALAAINGGCRWIQVRMKNATDSEVKKAVDLIMPTAHLTATTVLIDDRVHLVQKTGASGVHLGKEDMSPAEARTILGPDAVIGATVNTTDDILNLNHSLITYMGMGPFRFTTTKKRLSPVIGLEGYRRAIAVMREADITTPVVAIGGITIDDIVPLMATGIDGIAVSGAVSHATDPTAETRKFINLIYSQKCRTN